MTFNQELIEKARKGEIAILNDESLTLTDLQKLLNEIWPFDMKYATGGHKYYYCANHDKVWSYGEVTTLPSHLAKEFMTESKESFKAFLEKNCSTDQPGTYRVSRQQMKEIFDALETDDDKEQFYTWMRSNYPVWANQTELTEGQLGWIFKFFEGPTALLKSIFPEYFFIPEGEPVLVRFSNDDDQWWLRISDGKGGAYVGGRLSGPTSPCNEIIPFTKNPPK